MVDRGTCEHTTLASRKQAASKVVARSSPQGVNPIIFIYSMTGVPLLLCLVLLPAVAALPRLLAVDAAHESLNNLLPPNLVSLFDVSLSSPPTSTASFTYSATESKVTVTGSTPGAIVAGVHDYLKTYMNVSLSWDATGGSSFPTATKPVATELTALTSPYTMVYDFNVCTYGYSGMWWWNWERWEHELDLMAANGGSKCPTRNAARRCEGRLRRASGVEQAAKNDLLRTTCSERPAQNDLLRTTGSERPAQNDRLRTTGSERPAQNDRLRTTGSERLAQNDLLKTTGSKRPAQNNRQQHDLLLSLSVQYPNPSLPPPQV